MKGNILSNIFTVIVNILTPLIVIPIITREVGVDGYGLYYSKVAFVALICIITDVGFNLYIPKAIVSSRNSDGVISVINSYLMTKFILLPFSLILTYALNFGSALLYDCLSIYLFFSVINLGPILTGLEKYKFLALITLIGKLLVVFLVFIVDFSNQGVEKAILIQGINQGFLFVCSLIYLQRMGVVKYKLSFLEMYVLVKDSMGFYFSKLFVNIYQQSSSYIVSLLLTMEEVGIYSIALQLYKVGQSLIGAVSKVLYTSTVKNKNIDNVYSYCRISLLVYIIGMPIVLTFSDIILSAILSVDISEIIPLVYVFYMSLVFVLFSSYFGYPVLASISKDRYAHIGLYLSSVVYFLIMSVLYAFSYYSLMSFVLAIVLADLSAMISRLYYCKKFGVFDFIKLFRSNKSV
ncbi:oligosaccharide flippase family protein [Vibrio alfacsensis]|uniref:oligosaccharide flippase family protein n=1 Tax=Vibrio alfacsensis TaxID=1074311 RepID=UPI004069739C